MPKNPKDDVVPFRVALMLKRYKFGSNVAARYLGKPRGLVQSWMQSGESHALAERHFKVEAFEKKLRSIRRAITKENIYYLLAAKLLEMDLPAEYIGKHLGVPPSTVRAWKEGVSPKAVKRIFVDTRYLDREFAKLREFMSYESTKENLPYYLSLKLVSEARNSVGPRRIGGKTISSILYNHLNMARPIPKETITCWVEGRRRPKTAFRALRNSDLINEEFGRIVDALTEEHMDYNRAMTLYNDHNWSYAKISQTLELDKEKVRGWVKKGRGNPIAKTFVNHSKVRNQVEIYLVQNPPSDSEENQAYETPDLHSPETDVETGYDSELEDEILYHLSFFPKGIASPQAIKSILIDNKEADLNAILDVLENSPKIAKKMGRWVLKG
jgi:hypothetical protein